MSDYYFDVETKGTPIDSELVSIQYWATNSGSGLPKGDLVILKAWESSEEQIVREFHAVFQPESENPFVFVPIGENLTFDLMVMWNAWKRAGIEVSLEKLLYNRPKIDIKSDLVRMCGGNFKGASLTMLCGNNAEGGEIPKWYEAKEFAKIEAYVRAEAEEFLKYYKMSLPYFRNLKSIMQKERK
jgi:hypothetical protein